MRIWDIDPGFLNDRSLLGEHRELHGIASILIHHKKGYSRHPETRRWQDRLAALAVRHGLLVAEMALRGFNHRSPLPPLLGEVAWPSCCIDSPAAQYGLLGRKYHGKPSGRLPLPRNRQELWARHKYSLMARSYAEYRRLGHRVAIGEIGFELLAAELVTWLRLPPPPGELGNALCHMWGHVSAQAGPLPETLPPPLLLAEIQRLAMGPGGPEYIRHSTALGELGCWCGKGDGGLPIL